MLVAPTTRLVVARNASANAREDKQCLPILSVDVNGRNGNAFWRNSVEEVCHRLRGTYAAKTQESICSGCDFEVLMRGLPNHFTYLLDVACHTVPIQMSKIQKLCHRTLLRANDVLPCRARYQL